MQSRNQYLLELRTEYLKIKSKKGQSALLDEAVKTHEAKQKIFDGQTKAKEQFRQR